MAIRELVELAARIAELERRFSGMMRHGTVAEVDTEAQRIRLDFGPAHGTSGRFLSPWIPYAQFSGALRVQLDIVFDKSPLMEQQRHPDCIKIISSLLCSIRS